MNMNKTTRNQNGGVNIEPEKLYTQLEVNALLEKDNNGRSYLEKEIKKETQAENKVKRLNNTAVDNLIKKSNRILISMSSHAFPFDLFPDVINVEEERITIISRHLFSSVVHSVDIKDISNIFINRSFLFSQLVFVSKTFERNEVKMKNLRTKEAVFVRRIIEGLRVFIDNDIDTYNFTKEELIGKLEKLSKTEIVT